jgi:hypothetical protein
MSQDTLRIIAGVLAVLCVLAFILWRKAQKKAVAKDDL